jgi:two-component system NtrC family sensor kinase
MFFGQALITNRRASTQPDDRQEGLNDGHLHGGPPQSHLRFSLCAQQMMPAAVTPYMDAGPLHSQPSPLSRILPPLLAGIAEKNARTGGGILDRILEATGAVAGVLSWPAHFGQPQAVCCDGLGSAETEWLYECKATGEPVQIAAAAGEPPPHETLWAACWSPATDCSLTLSWRNAPDPGLIRALGSEQAILHSICLLLAQTQDIAAVQKAMRRTSQYQAILAESLEWLHQLEHQSQLHFSDRSIHLGLLTRVRIVCNLESAGIRLYRKSGEAFQWLHQNFPEAELTRALAWQPQEDEGVSRWEIPDRDGPISLLELKICTHQGLRARLYLRSSTPTGSAPRQRFSEQDIANSHQLATLTFKALENMEIREDLRLSNQFLAMEREDHTRLIAELRDTRQQLQHTDKLASLGLLAAGVAHEINNPVSFLGSNINALKRHFHSLQEVIARGEALAASHGAGPLLPAAEAEEQTREIGEILEESREGLERVRQIVQDLRNFSRSGDATMQMTDLHQCLDSTLNILRNEFRHKAELVKDYGELPLVECVAGQINQVFMNLLVNAAQAIEKEGRISIHTGRVDDLVFVRIEDSGSGIPESCLHRIFDPFFTTKPIGSGTGLGLSLSYGIIQRHHGRIDVSSTPGTGTCFTIWLPVTPPAGASIP